MDGRHLRACGHLPAEGTFPMRDPQPQAILVSGHAGHERLSVPACRRQHRDDVTWKRAFNVIPGTAMIPQEQVSACRNLSGRPHELS
jgi:hypothetical protein